MSWSSGKDSALALHEVREAGELDVVGLLTTVNAEFDRVAMHGVRRALLEAQAKALGLALHVVELPWPCPNEAYEKQMARAIDEARRTGIAAMVFGDLFLEDIRRYRESALDGTGVKPFFPLWQRSTRQVARSLVELGFRALVVCVDPSLAPREIAGRWYDKTLLGDLPREVDPCGENGEFHTVVVDGPGFAHPVDVEVCEVVERDGFVFADVIPTSEGGARESGQGGLGGQPASS